MIEISTDEFSCCQWIKREEILLKMVMPYPEHFIKSNHNEVQALKSQPIMR